MSPVLKGCCAASPNPPTTAMRTGAASAMVATAMPPIHARATSGRSTRSDAAVSDIETSPAFGRNAVTRRALESIVKTPSAGGPTRRPCSPCSRRGGERGSLGAALLDQLRDQGGPAGLMARSDAGPVVAVEVLVEQEEVAEVR